MKSFTKKKFEEQGFAIVKNVLNFDNDLKPILNEKIKKVRLKIAKVINKALILNYFFHIPRHTSC